MTENAELATQIASAAKWGGASAAVTGALTINEWLGICGLIVAILGACINIWINFHYKRKEDKRAEAVHYARMEGWSE